jgi:hypothetical protein
MTTYLEALKPGPLVQGLVGRKAVRILSRDEEAKLKIVSTGSRWSDEGDGDPFPVTGAHHHKETPS